MVDLRSPRPLDSPAAWCANVVRSTVFPQEVYLAALLPVPSVCVVSLAPSLFFFLSHTHFTQL